MHECSKPGSLVSILSQYNQNSNLERYISNRLDLPQFPELHESMLNVIVVLLDQDLMKNDPKKKTQHQLLDQLDIFLAILEKLMFQHIHRANKKLTKKSQRFSSTFLTNLEKLVKRVCHLMAQIKSAGLAERCVDDVTAKATESLALGTVKAASMALTKFFSTIFWICEVGFVCKLIASMLNDEVLSFHNDEQTIFLRIEIIKKLSEHEVWVPINFPNFQDLNMKSLKLTRAFCERHYLVGELLRLVQFALTCNTPKAAQIRKRTLEVFISVLTKHCLDNRYGGQKEQTRIVQLFAPFIGFLTRHFHHLNIDMHEFKVFERNPSIRSTATEFQKQLQEQATDIGKIK